MNQYMEYVTAFRRYITNVKGDSGLAESTCNNRMAVLRAYLNYVADSDISMRSIALGASGVPFLLSLLLHDGIKEENFR